MAPPALEHINFRPSVLVEEVSEALTRAILEGVLRGGDQLVEQKLQKQFGISRTPLREAFRVLEKKGLVVIIPRKGTFVRTITRKDIEDNFPVRAVLEGLAAREAHDKMGEQELKALKDSLQAMKEAAAREDALAYMEHHIRFHEIFINASGNDVLVSLLGNLRMHSMWYRFSYKYYKEDLNASLAVHKRILELFQAPEASKEEVAQVVRQHIEVALERFLAYLQEQEEKGE